MPKAQVSSKYVLLIAGLVSTVASLAGGLVMYYEGLKVIEATVKEVGKADIQYVKNRGQEVFATARGISFESAELLKRVRFGTKGEFLQWIREHFLWNCYVHRQGVETVGVRGYTANGSEPDHIYELAWHERRRDGSYDWVQAHYDYDTNSEAQCGPPFPCVSAYSQDITRNPRVALANIYNYSDSGRVEEVRTMRAEHGDTVVQYQTPRIWYASDDTPFFYFNLFTAIPPLSLPMFSAPMHFTFTMAIVSDPWVEMMRNYQTEAKLLVAQMDAGPQSIVMAGRGVAGVDPPTDCRGAQNSDSSLHPCMRYVLHLDEEVRDIVSQMTTQPVDTFTEIRGHWVRKALLFQKSPQDQLQNIYLLWFRPKATVEEDMNKALYLLIGFASGVLLFDLFIRALELLLIPAPLAGLAEVVALMTEYSLDEAQGRAEEVERGLCCVEIAEVGKLRQGLVFALESLRDYKAYLPQTLFDAPDDEPPTDTEDSTKSSATASGSRATTASTSRAPSAVVPHAKRTDRTLQQVKGVLMTCRLFDVEEKGKLVPEAVQSVVAALQSTCSAHRAVLHLWSAAAADTVFVSLNMSSRCSDPTARAADLAWEVMSCMSAACAFVARPFQHGNLGTATLRGYTIHAAGSPLMQLLEYATYLHHMAMPVVLTDPKTAESLFGRTLPVGKVLSKGGSGKQQTVLAHHVLQSETVDAQEWMYEMEDMEKKDLLSQAMLALCTDGAVPDDVLRAVDKRPANNTLEEKLKMSVAECRPPVFEMTFTVPWGAHGE